VLGMGSYLDQWRSSPRPRARVLYWVAVGDGGSSGGRRWRRQLWWTVVVGEAW
jgi:hypothetical protein